MAPCVLEQTSLTINTPCSSTTQSLSSSTSKHHPPSVVDVIPSCCFAQATRVPCHHLSRALSRTTPSHSHSLAITTCYSLSPSIFEPHPPFIVDTTPRVPHGYGDTRGVSKTGNTGSGTVLDFATPRIPCTRTAVLRVFHG